MRSRHARLVAAFLCSLITTTALSEGTASTPVLEVDPLDRPLRIESVCAPKGCTVSATVRIKASANVNGLRLLPTDLTPSVEGNKTVIGKSSITTQTNSLQKGRQDVPISISNVPHSGSWKGTLSFEAGDERVDVPVDLIVTTPPNAAPRVLPVVWKATSCSLGWACGWVDSLLTNELQGSEREILVDNSGDALEMTPSLSLWGEKTGYSPSSDAIVAIEPHTLNHDQSQFRITLNRAALPADHYQGRIRFSASDKLHDPLVINLGLDVRDGPLWPLLAIVAGIFLGRFAQRMGTPAALRIQQNMKTYYELRAAAEEVQDAKAREYLRKLLDRLKQDGVDPAVSDASVSAQVAQLKEQTSFLAGLERLESLSASEPDLAKPIQEGIQEARKQLIEDNDLTAAEAIRAKLEKLLKETPHAMTKGGPGFAARLTTKAPRPPPGYAVFLNRLVSSPVMGAEFQYLVLRPLLFFMLLVGLCLVGLQSSYLSSATFGVNGLYDYLGLVLWGIGSDLTQKTLQNLAPIKPGF